MATHILYVSGDEHCPYQGDFTLSLASTLAEVHQAIKKNPPDAIVIGADKKEKSFLKSVRQAFPGPIVVLAADPGLEQAFQSGLLGMDACLLAPYTSSNDLATSVMYAICKHNFKKLLSKTDKLLSLPGAG